MPTEYRAGRRKGYTVILRSVAQDKNLSLKARGLFLLMQSLPDDWHLTQNGLAAFAGVGRDQVRAALEELKNAGYLVREQTHDASGKFAGSVYTLREELPEAPTTSSPEPATERPLAENPAPENHEPLSGNPTTGKPSTENPTGNNIIYTKQDNNIPPIPPEGDGAAALDLNAIFDRFWAAYPRKQKRADALKAWNQIHPDLALCRVMSDALRVQKQSEQWARDGGRYIPLAGSWLRGRRWEDDPGPMATGNRNPGASGDPYADIPPDDPRRGRWL